MKKSALLLSTSVLLLVPGCFDIEQGIHLEDDLSGRATVEMTVDMEPMAFIAAKMKKSMAGDDSDPTAEELAAARQEMIEEGDADGPTAEEMAEEKAKIESRLPDGVELLDLSMKKDGLKMHVAMTFSFDHVSKLSQIRLEEEKQEGAGGDQNPVSKPFEGLEYVDEGETYVLRSQPTNPTEGGPAEEAPPGMEEAVEKAMSGMKVVFRIESPHEVVEHNATRVDDRTLVWEFDMEKLKAMGEDGAAEGMIARFKK